MSKCIINLSDDCNMVQQICLTENGNVYIKGAYAENLEELNSDYINEHYGQLQDDAYQRGLEEGKAQSERGCEGCRYESNKKSTYPCSECAYNYKNQWTAKDDKIEVGDEIIERDGNKTLVSNIHGELFDGLCSDGSTICDLFLEDVVKTGRHFDIASILEEMRK